MKIAVAIVTFNRLDFLKDLINAIRNQTRKPDYILVTNNSSTDGTEEWLKDQKDIKYVTQDNVGSSGGQYRSIQECMKSDADYFWIMDDDVLPDERCLENLIPQLSEKRLITPIRITYDGHTFFNEPISFNLSWPFKSVWNKIIDQNYLDSFDNFVPAIGLTFEGPIFNRKLIEKVGYPEYDFFIHADDTDFMIRANKAGYELGICKNAILNRRLPVIEPIKQFTWKHYYVIRNVMILDLKHGRYWVKLLRPFFYKLSWLRRAKTNDEKQTVLKAYKDARNYLKGKND
jgi:GT2 family glycosyltransferase